MSPGLNRRALGLWATGLSRGAAGQTLAPAGTAVDWPTLTLVDGRPLAPAHWAGRPALLVFFRNDCGFCVRHLDRVQQWLDDGASKTWRFLALADETDAAAVRAHLAAQRWRFEAALLQPAFRAQFSTRRMVPLSCVVDRRGVQREIIPGEMSADDIHGLGHWALTDH